MWGKKNVLYFSRNVNWCSHYGKQHGQSSKIFKLELPYDPAHLLLGFPGGSAGKESTCNAEDLDLIPGLGRSPGEGNGYPLHYSGLENSMDCIVHEVAKSQTWLSNFHFTSLLGIYPKETKTGSPRDICTPLITAVWFTTAKIRKQATCPSTDQQIKKLYNTHQGEQHSAIRKKEILPFVTTWRTLKALR